MRRTSLAVAAVGTLIASLAPPALAADPGTWRPTSPPDAPTWVVLESGPGDHIGQGAAFEYTAQDAVITVSPLASAYGDGFQVSVRGDESWDGRFEVPAGEPVDERLYDGATRFPFNADSEPGLSWTGEGRGCNTLTGWFVIDGFSYAPDGSVEFLALRFEQRCDSSSAPLHGAVRYDAGAPSPEPLNPRPIPAGLWTPDPALLPAGDAPLVVLESDPGDWVGQGGTYVYEGSAVSLRTTGNRIEVDVSTPTDWWYGDFAPPDVDDRLEVGLYDDLQRFPFHNPMLGGLDWSGMGRGCNTLVGWFVVDDVWYTPNGVVGRLSLRFEQRCGGAGAPALHGHVAFGIDRGPGDVTAPTVTITSGPADRVKTTSATFTFVADEGGVTFACALDGGSPEPCASPWTVEGVGAGDHTVSITGTDAAGNVSSPATWSWAVKGGKGGGKGKGGGRG